MTGLGEFGPVILRRGLRRSWTRLSKKVRLVPARARLMIRSNGNAHGTGNMKLDIPNRPRKDTRDSGQCLISHTDGKKSSENRTPGAPGAKAQSLALNMYARNLAMDSSYRYNHGRFEDSHYYNVNEGENEMKIDVISDKAEKPQIESEEDQPLVLVQPTTLSCTFGTPYKGVKVRERSHIFYTADTFLLDDPDATNSFVLEVPNELLNLKEGVHASLPKYIHATFVVDISKGEGIT
ncbi:hypothetical protein Syun_016778 [Stephania yunnanensis]|uniref:Uncharacterized protein n=1 Tax=Stephania yunnanensis TaxID=152371 RepID=A0AAP0J819_9MAGN